jgi:hypothetical protein
LPVGGDGRLWVRSPCDTIGYRKRPDATAETIRRRRRRRVIRNVAQDHENGESRHAVVRTAFGRADRCPKPSGPRPREQAGRGGAAVCGGRQHLARAGPRKRPAGRQHAGVGRPPRRSGRFAHAQPQCPDHPLPRLLQGGVRGHAAQLPLHAAGDRSCARGQRGHDPAGARRARPGSGHEQARAPAAAGHDRLRRRAPPRPQLRGADPAPAAPAGDPAAVLVRFCSHLLHLGQHRQAQGRHPQLRDRRLNVRERDPVVRDGAAGRDDVRRLELAYRRLRVLAHGDCGRLSDRDRAHLRRRRDFAAAASGPPDGALDAARGADHACA